MLGFRAGVPGFWGEGHLLVRGRQRTGCCAESELLTHGRGLMRAGTPARFRVLSGSGLVRHCTESACV